eukprot:scaffold11726_cov112-Cylindrotheca_fusiformis.AAC.5
MPYPNHIHHPMIQKRPLSQIQPVLRSSNQSGIVATAPAGHAWHIWWFAALSPTSCEQFRSKNVSLEQNSKCI